MAYKIWVSTDVYYILYIPSSVTCYTNYPFAVVTTAPVNTNIVVTIFWYGDLGGFFYGDVTINSGATCGSNYNVYTGGDINCASEANTNFFSYVTPNPSGGQNYAFGNYYYDYYPC
jgi:Flp pilus assembly protein TadG